MASFIVLFRKWSYLELRTAQLLECLPCSADFNAQKAHFKAEHGGMLLKPQPQRGKAEIGSSLGLPGQPSQSA